MGDEDRLRTINGGLFKAGLPRVASIEQWEQRLKEAPHLTSIGAYLRGGGGHSSPGAASDEAE